MAQKNNIRSIRFSDELAELINRQVGKTFTQKFENLVTRCVYELPKKEEELKWLDSMIARKRQELRVMQATISDLSYTTNLIKQKTSQLESAIIQELKKWDNPEA